MGPMAPPPLVEPLLPVEPPGELPGAVVVVVVAGTEVVVAVVGVAAAAAAAAAAGAAAGAAAAAAAGTLVVEVVAIVAPWGRCKLVPAAVVGAGRTVAAVGKLVRWVEGAVVAGKLVPGGRVVVVGVVGTPAALLPAAGDATLPHGALVGAVVVAAGTPVEEELQVGKLVQGAEPRGRSGGRNPIAVVVAVVAPPGVGASKDWVAVRCTAG